MWDVFNSFSTACQQARGSDNRKIGSMSAIVLTAFFAFIALTAVTALADSALRWWSAFGLLNASGVATGVAPALLRGRRAEIVHGGFSGYGRATGARQPSQRCALRAAA